MVAGDQLVAAVEFKSQVGPSFGNNFKNRIEEAIGNATDVWTAFREGRLGPRRPLLGYFFLLEGCPQAHTPVKNAEPHFPIDPAFRGASYSRRHQLLCQRLVLKRLYDAACLTLATKNDPTRDAHPLPALDFRQFATQLKGHAQAFARGR